MKKAFDRGFLVSLLDKYDQYKILVNREFLHISDIADLKNSEFGYGSNETGQMKKFSFLDIEEVHVGNSIITIDQIQDIEKELDKKSEEPKETGESPDEKPPKPEDNAKEETPSPPKRQKPGGPPQESLNPGDRVVILERTDGFSKGIVNEVEHNHVFIKAFNGFHHKLIYVPLKQVIKAGSI